MTSATTSARYEAEEQGQCDANQRPDYDVPDG